MSPFFTSPDTIYLTNISQILKNESQKIKIESSSGYTTIYSPQNLSYITSDNPKVSFSGGISENSFYWYSLRNIHQNYVLQEKNFSLTPLSSGEFYIHTYLASKGKIFIYSLNSVLRVDLTSEDGENVYNSLTLFPKTLLIFDPKTGEYMKQSDALRVSTIYRFHTYDTLDMYMSDVSLGVSENEKKFLDFAKSQFLVREKEVQNILRKMQNYEVGIEEESYISRNMPFLIFNKEKKIIYLKNKIFYSIFSDFLGKEMRNNEEIEKNLEILKNYNQYSYVNMSELDAFFSFLNFFNKTSSSQKNNSEKYNQIFYIFENFSSLSPREYEQNFQDFSNFLSENYKNFTQQELQYIALAYADILERGIDEEGRDITFYGEFVEKYFFLLDQAYKTEKNSYITALLLQQRLGKKFLTQTFDAYFEPERSTDNLLVLKGKQMDAQSLKNFSHLVAYMEKSYNEKIIYLNENNIRDTSMKKEIESFLQLSKEMIAALENYDSYTFQYDPKRKIILDGFLSGETLYSPNDMELFLRTFQGISGNFIILPSETNMYFSIQDFYVNGEKMSFDIFPYEDFSLRNIKLNEENLAYSYKIPIDQEKEKLTTLNKMFFIETFLQKKDSTVEVFELVTPIQGEDDDIVLFKKETLLGKNGILSSLSPEFIFQYNSLYVQETATGFITTMKNIPYSFQTEEKQEGYMNAIFFIEPSSAYFENIQFSYQFETLGNIIISVPGRIKKENIKNIFLELESHIVDYKNILNILQGKNNISNIQIFYKYTPKKSTISFDSGKVSYNITFANGKIDRIMRGNTSLSSKIIPIKDLASYIP